MAEAAVEALLQAGVERAPRRRGRTAYGRGRGRAPIASTRSSLSRSARATAARDLRDLERVRQPRAVVVALGRDEDLRLVLEAPEGLAVHDPADVALQRRAQPAVASSTRRCAGYERAASGDSRRSSSSCRRAAKSSATGPGAVLESTPRSSHMQSPAGRSRRGESSHPLRRAPPPSGPETPRMPRTTRPQPAPPQPRALRAGNTANAADNPAHNGAGLRRPAAHRRLRRRHPRDRHAIRRARDVVDPRACGRTRSSPGHRHARRRRRASRRLGEAPSHAPIRTNWPTPGTSSVSNGERSKIFISM